MKPALSTLSIDEIRTLEGFESLAGEWNALLERSWYDAPFLRHEWLSAWWRHFGHGAQLAIYVARRSGALVLGLPLMRRSLRVGPVEFTTLRSLTNDHSGRFHFLVQRGAENAWIECWRHLHAVHAADLMVLTDVPLDVGLHSELISAVREAGGRAGVWPAFDSAYIAPACEWKIHEQTVAASVRKRLRNQMNRLNKLGPVAIEALTDPDEIAETLPEAFHIEACSWKGQQGSAIACQTELRAFYTDIALAAARQGWMRLSFLRVGGVRAAFEFALRYRRKHYSLKIGYDEGRFARYSAGRLLVRDSLVQCFDERLAEYDFIGPLAPAHSEWKPNSRPIGWVFLYRPSVLSAAHHTYKFSAVPWFKHLLANRRRLVHPVGSRNAAQAPRESRG